MEQATQARSGGLSLARYGGSSTFRSGVPGSAIWFVVNSGRTDMYRSQGLTAVKLIQCAVGATPDGYWGPMTSAAMRKHVELSRPDVNKAFVRDGEITAAMLRYGLSAAFGTPFSLDDQSAEDTILPPGTSLPRWMQLAPGDGAYSGLAWTSPYPMVPSIPAASVHPRYGQGLPCASRMGAGRVVVAPMQAVPPSGALEHSPRPVTQFLSWVGQFLDADGPSAATSSPAQILGGLLACGFALTVALVVDDDGP